MPSSWSDPVPSRDSAPLLMLEAFGFKEFMPRCQFVRFAKVAHYIETKRKSPKPTGRELTPALGFFNQMALQLWEFLRLYRSYEIRALVNQQRVAGFLNADRAAT